MFYIEEFVTIISAYQWMGMCDFTSIFPEDEHSEQFQTNKLQLAYAILR